MADKQYINLLLLRSGEAWQRNLQLEIVNHRPLIGEYRKYNLGYPEPMLVLLDRSIKYDGHYYRATYIIFNIHEQAIFIMEG